MTSGYGMSLNIPALVSETSPDALRPVSSSALEVLLKGLPDMLLRQYEDFKELIVLDCDLGRR